MPQLLWSCNEYTFSRRHIHLSTGRLARGGDGGGGGVGVGKGVRQWRLVRAIFGQKQTNAFS